MRQSPRGAVISEHIKLSIVKTHYNTLRNTYDVNRGQKKPGLVAFAKSGQALDGTRRLMPEAQTATLVM